MKFKDLRNKIEENHQTMKISAAAVGPFNPDGAVDTSDISIASLTGEALNRLNAFLGGAFAKSYISTSNVMNQIKNKLEMVGLFFEYRQAPAKVGADITNRLASDANPRDAITELGEGEHEFALSYLGGSYGRYPTDPGFDPYKSDNITPKVGTPLVLCVNIAKEENGTYFVRPAIKQK